MIEYEYAHAYPVVDGWELGSRVEGRVLIIVSEREFAEHKPDGYNALGEPYWNYLRYMRPKPTGWKSVE